jgi:hypothetical protein
MKKLFQIFAFAFFSLSLYSQEFQVYNNGLIYSEATMNKLQFIVDSLNLKFKRCDLYKKYYSLKQGKGHYIRVEGPAAKKALNDLYGNIPLSSFLNKYKTTDLDSGLMIREYEFKNDEGEKITTYRSETMDNNNDSEIELKENGNNKFSGKTGNWVYFYSKATKYSKEDLEAFYFTKTPSEKEIPAKYSRMILYTDCLIDTAENVFLKSAKPSGWRFRAEEEQKDYPAVTDFQNYIERNTKNIVVRYHMDTSAEDSWFLQDSLVKVFVKDTLSHKQKFKNLLAVAVKEVLKNNIITNDAFEYYTAEYYSEKDALTMKRNRMVIGGCSMDNSPRIHAMKIAVLSARSTSWEIFLRAHLDIMNDRFERVSDGSYAWGARETYIREIEELNIDVQELILGICLRISNPSQNHYFGNIGRLGRALAETKNRADLENKILSMIQDPELDDYNRLLMHYLFLNYTYYLPNKDDRMHNLDKLESADKYLPEYLRVGIKINRKNFEQEKS